MSLAVVNGTTTSSIGANSLADLNLSVAQSAQIEQILSELQSGMLSPVEARAQIASIVSAPAQQSSSSQTSTPQSSTATVTGEPLQQYYELPLPQESLKSSLPSYNSHGAATDAIFSGSSRSVNASA
jgi:hypothetical protein